MTSFRTWMGAVIVLLLFICILFSISVTTLVLLNGERGWPLISLCFGPWILAMILYLSLALPRKCSVCRAHVFSFKKYTRNKAAHHIPLFGYVFATALHIFLFRWFRCPACGSSQQLGNAELNSTGINEALAPAPDFPGSRFLAFSFPLARYLEEDSSSVFPSIISSVPSLQIRVSTEQKAPSCFSWFQGMASGKAYPPFR